MEHYVSLCLWIPLRSKPFPFICFCSVLFRVALETLDRLTESLDFTDYASRIIHPIVRTLDSTPELRSTSMDTLSSLVFQLGKKVTVAAPPGPPFRCSYYSVDFLPPLCCWPPIFITSCQTGDVIGLLVVGGSVYESWWGHIYPFLPVPL